MNIVIESIVANSREGETVRQEVSQSDINLALRNLMALPQVIHIQVGARVFVRNTNKGWETYLHVEPTYMSEAHTKFAMNNWSLYLRGISVYVPVPGLGEANSRKMRFC